MFTEADMHILNWLGSRERFIFTWNKEFYHTLEFKDGSYYERHGDSMTEQETDCKICTPGEALSLLKEHFTREALWGKDKKSLTGSDDVWEYIKSYYHLS